MMARPCGRSKKLKGFRDAKAGNRFKCPYCRDPIGNVAGHIQQKPQCRRAHKLAEEESRARHTGR